MILLHDKMSTQNELISQSKVQAVLQDPISAKIHQVLNGDYSYQITMHCNNPILKKLEYLSIIQSNSGQLFFLNHISKQGRTVTLYCPHIWYYLAHRPVWCGAHEGYDIWDSVRDILQDEKRDEREIHYNFSFASDISNKWINWDYHLLKKAYALLGSPESIVNRFNGELYRDNFYFSINKRIEHSADDAFYLADGFNATSINEDIDASDMITEVYATDNYGGLYDAFWGWSDKFPHHMTGTPKFSYNGEPNLREDADKYFYENVEPKHSLRVNFATLRKSNRESPYMQLENFQLGDTGKIRSSVLDIDVTDRIIELTYDDLRNVNESCALGNKLPSAWGENRYDKLLAKDDSPGRRLDVLEKAQNDNITREDIQNLFATDTE